MRAPMLGSIAGLELISIPIVEGVEIEKAMTNLAFSFNGVLRGRHPNFVNAQQYGEDVSAISSPHRDLHLYFQS